MQPVDNPKGELQELMHRLKCDPPLYVTSARRRGYLSTVRFNIDGKSYKFTTPYAFKSKKKAEAYLARASLEYLRRYRCESTLKVRKHPKGAKAP